MGTENASSKIMTTSAGSDYGNAEYWGTISNFCEIILPIQVCFGVAGNIVNLYVLCSKTMKGRTNMLLSLIAISDIFFFIFLCFNYLGRYPSLTRSSPKCVPTPIDNCMTWFHDFSMNTKKHFTAAANGASFVSSWLIVTVCFDRLWAIKTPLKFHGETCSKGIWTTVIVICFFGIAFSSFHNFAFIIVPNSNSTFNITGINKGIQSMAPSPHQTLMKTITLIQVLCQICIPVVLLTITNALLLYYIRNRCKNFQIQRWNPSKNSFDSCHSSDPNDTRSSKIWSRSHSTNERKITTTVCGIVTCYIVSNLPSGILCIVIYIVNSGEWYRNKMELALFFISNGIIVFGKIANFFLLCNASSYFRSQIYKQIIEKICKCCRKRDRTPRVHYTKLDGVNILRRRR